MICRFLKDRILSFPDWLLCLWRFLKRAIRYVTFACSTALTLQNGPGFRVCFVLNLLRANRMEAEVNTAFHWLKFQTQPGKILKNN